MRRKKKNPTQRWRKNLEEKTPRPIEHHMKFAMNFRFLISIDLCFDIPKNVLSHRIPMQVLAEFLIIRSATQWKRTPRQDSAQGCVLRSAGPYPPR